jgi:hypothetical protein
MTFGIQRSFSRFPDLARRVYPEEQHLQKEFVMVLSRFGWWTLVLAAALLPLGCSAFDDDNDDDRSSKSDEVKTRDEMPSGADRVAQTRAGEDINWKAKETGTVYLVDHSSDRVVYTGTIKEGNRLEVDVSKGRLLNNDKEPSPKPKIKDDVEYRLYFKAK